MKCSKCGFKSDGSRKFYKEWKETYKSSGDSSREEIIVCENCSEKDTETKPKCEKCGREGFVYTERTWCSPNCQWRKDKQFCNDCFYEYVEHSQEAEEHRRTCQIYNSNNNPNRERERERERERAKSR